MKTIILNLLQDIIGDAAFSGFGETTQERIYNLIDELNKDRGRSFEDLPIIFEETESKPDGWCRKVRRTGTVAELLNTWDIDGDEDYDCVMSQVLRHLRRVMAE